MLGFSGSTCGLGSSSTEAVVPRGAGETVGRGGGPGLVEVAAHGAGLGRGASLRTEVTLWTQISVRLGDRGSFAGSLSTEMT